MPAATALVDQPGATDPFQAVERVTPRGHGSVLATKCDGLVGRSALAFGTGRECTSLYITSLGFFGGTHRPGQQKLHVGIPGDRLPWTAPTIHLDRSAFPRKGDPDDHHHCCRHHCRHHHGAPRLPRCATVGPRRLPS